MFGIKGLGKILLVLLLSMFFQTLPVSANSGDSIDSAIVNEEQVEVSKEKRNIFEDFYYRLFLKDTKDFFDYVLLGIFVVGLLIVMVFQNTHYVVVKRPLEETSEFIDSKANYDIKEVVVEPEVVKETVIELEKSEEKNPEILSSELLEEENLDKEEEPKAPKKRRNNRRNYKGKTL